MLADYNAWPEDRPSRKKTNAPFHNEYFKGTPVVSHAVRPDSSNFLPVEGYKKSVGQKGMPVIMAAAAREKITDLFSTLIEPLGERVDVVLETEHHMRPRGIYERRYRDIESLTLRSCLWDHEHLIRDDGHTGIAVVGSIDDTFEEVFLTSHKVIIIFNLQRGIYEEILQDYGLLQNQEQTFIHDRNHTHYTSGLHHRDANKLHLELSQLGAIDGEDPFSDVTR